MTLDSQPELPGPKAQVVVEPPWELGAWARHFGVTEEELRRAVEEVGPVAEDVCRYLLG